MQKNRLFPAFNAVRSSKQEVGCKSAVAPASPAVSKSSILDGLTNGTHLLTLLGQACGLIAELTNDPDFYKEARGRARCRGIAENHAPSLIERWEQLQDEIERTTGNYHLETDTACKQLFRTMTDSLCRHQVEISRQLEAQGMIWAPEYGWTYKSAERTQK